MNNIELVKSAYESFGKGDMETFKSLLSDQFVFKVPGEYSHAGVFNGADDVIEYCFSQLMQNIHIGIQRKMNQFGYVKQ